MKKLSRILAGLSMTAVMAVSAVSFSGSAATTVRDANGDGYFDIADAVDTRMYLLGLYNPTNVKSYDFDGNGIISMADVQKIQCCKAWLLDQSSFPPPSTEVTNAVSTSRSYYKHDCSSSNLSAKSLYTLTVKSNDNSSSNNNNENITPYTIIPPNNMVRDYDTAVVELTMNGTSHGSGFIVGDHLIATAAHCVYGNSKFFNVKIDIVGDDSNSIATFTPSYIHIPVNYALNYSTNYDYALIYVDEDLSDYGMFQMGVALDEYADKNGSVIASGFPGEYPDNYTGNYGVRFKAQGNISSENQYKLYYDADTFGGNSGGPVYVEEGFKIGKDSYDYKTVIAIHTNGFDIDVNPNGKNSGTKITPDILAFYYNNPEMN